MLRTSTRVRVGKMAFVGQANPQACILATQIIPAETYLWELNAILSSDLIQVGAVSVMQAHPSQRLSPGNRILAGTARITNHHCDSNALVRFVLFKTLILTDMDSWNRSPSVPYSS
jgi:hypothetical protein